MTVVKAEDLIPGKVYVSDGGLLQLKPEGSKKVGWGYERVEFIKIHENYIIVATPWDTECWIQLKYGLSATKETTIRSIFPLRGMHISREVIPFDTALELGLTKEITAGELRKERKEGDTSGDTKRSTVGRDQFIDNLIVFFSEFKSYAEAAKHFNIVYQKIRYTIEGIKKRGHNLQRFTCETEKKGVTKVKLTRV